MRQSRPLSIPTRARACFGGFRRSNNSYPGARPGLESKARVKPRPRLALGRGRPPSPSSLQRNGFRRRNARQHPRDRRSCPARAPVSVTVIVRDGRWSLPRLVLVPNLLLLTGIQQTDHQNSSQTGWPPHLLLRLTNLRSRALLRLPRYPDK